MEAHPDVNEQVLIPGLEIPRNATRSAHTSAILDQPILDNKTPVLQPSPNFIAKNMQKINDFGKSLLGYIPPKPKMIDEALESFKNLIKKLFKKRDFLPIQRVIIYVEKFAIQYRTDGKDWIDPDLFLVGAKQSIKNLLINRRQTKDKLILSCIMVKVDLKSGEVIAKEAEFHFKTEVNLEITNSNELFSKMKETVLESSAEVEIQGSNWRFRSVLSLDRHTVKYEPLAGSSYIPLPAFLAAKKTIINL